VVRLPLQRMHRRKTGTIYLRRIHNQQNQSILTIPCSDTWILSRANENSNLFTKWFNCMCSWMCDLIISSLARHQIREFSRRDNHMQQFFSKGHIKNFRITKKLWWSNQGEKRKTPRAIFSLNLNSNASSGITLFTALIISTRNQYIGQNFLSLIVLTLTLVTFWLKCILFFTWCSTSFEGFKRHSSSKWIQEAIYKITFYCFLLIFVVLTKNLESTNTTTFSGKKIFYRVSAANQVSLTLNLLW